MFEYILSFLLLLAPNLSLGAEVSITIDDPNQTFSDDIMSKSKRDLLIRRALEKHGITAALFVCGKRVDSSQGKQLLKDWDQERHLIANHTYSHKNYHSSSFDFFSSDILSIEEMIKSLNHFEPFFRFPMLKAGNTAKKRDLIREFFHKKGYQNGYVTIDASDWYIDHRLRKKLKSNPHFDKSRFKEYYLEHLWNRANYYNNLSIKTIGREVKHTLLIHHNPLNALFLEDVLKMFKAKGWTLIDAREAFKDPVFKRKPNVVPAGESIIWSLAKEKGNQSLRYPAEDSRYEKESMDSAGL